MSLISEICEVLDFFRVSCGPLNTGAYNQMIAGDLAASIASLIAYNSLWLATVEAIEWKLQQIPEIPGGAALTPEDILRKALKAANSPIPVLTDT